MKSYDVIVIGTGGVGSAALFHLARRGARALGLDRFPPGHDRGSSHGMTRVIRLAYFEHPDYVPLLRRAYELWAELEGLCGRKLYQETGLLQIGPESGTVITGVLKSASEYGLAVETLERTKVHGCFPGFRVPEGCVGVLEKRAGFLRVEDCVRAHADQATKAGAELRAGPAVEGFRLEGSLVRVTAGGETFLADRLVVSPGAWAGDLLGGLGVSFAVLRKSVFWFATDDSSYAVENGCPIFLYETPAGIYYGFPKIDALGLKVAEHTGGAPVSDALAVDRSLRPEDLDRIESFLGGHLPGVTRTLTRHETCLYTLTADHHFVVDRHPEHPQVVFAAGLSGHGFKFTSVLGEVLADLALEGRTRHPIGFLGRDRAALRGASA
jgi:sarcosine oxidase